MKISPKQYARLIAEVTEGKTENQAAKEIAKVIKLIVDNGDIRRAGQVVAALELFNKEKEGIVDAQIISAIELSKEQLGEIKLLIADKKGVKIDKINLINLIDPSIKGGLIIKVNNEVWDGSIARRLQFLRESLSK